MAKSFDFKHFSLSNEKSAQKVGTDGVLLGAWTSLRGDERHILDVGTGTGVIALMLAQRSSPVVQGESKGSPVIIALDIDAPSAKEAGNNFKASPWAGRMAAYEGDFRGLGSDETHPLKFLAFPYDLIVSNPPYFVDSLKAPDPRRSNARHADSLSFDELNAAAADNLAPEGRLAVILPFAAATAFTRSASACGLFPSRRMQVSTLAGRSPVRILLEFSRSAAGCEEASLAIQDACGFTESYRSLTRDFYQAF